MGIFQQFPYTNFHEMNLDEIIKIMRQMQDEWEATKTEWASYKDFIDNYFANLNLDDETERALRHLVNDGTLDPVIDPVIASETASWLTEHITQPTTPVVDTSLSVSGAAADAKVTGDMINEINTDLSVLMPLPEFTWIKERNADASGNITFNAYMAITSEISTTGSDRIIRKTPTKDANNVSYIGYVTQYAADGSFISRSAFNTYDQVFTLGANTRAFRISFGRTSSSGVQISDADLLVFGFEIYREALSLIEYDETGFIERGNFSDLGYTSIAECVKSGFYRFTGSDTVSDLPVGWSGGGLVTTYNTNNTIWQIIESLSQRYIRYGITGQWYDPSQKLIAIYESGAGDNDSTEQLSIYLPKDRTNNRIRYYMGHCVNNADNADVWRIIYAYLEKYDGTTRRLTITGEWECALHLAGRSDFSGGLVHGDEVDTSVIAFVDGQLTPISDINGICDVIRIVRTSNLYDPDDHTTVIAKHGVEYVYDSRGLTVKQSVEWQGSYSLTNCYMAMLPVASAYSTERFDNTSFEIVTNPVSNYNVSIPNASMVTEYNDTYNVFFEVSVPEYPSGLTGGDKAIITDNNGGNYNKVYFPICSSGSVVNGDLWKTVTEYKHR